MKYRKQIIIAVLALLVCCTFVMNRLRPTVMAETHSPHPKGGSVRILAIPTDWLDALTFRYNPYYRFEYHWPDGYLWSAVTFRGESYDAQTASITWLSNAEAVVNLDGTPYFRLKQRNWVKITGAEQNNGQVSSESALSNELSL
ncbi:MAG: hypothetical protein PF692_05390 [Kiritimatiellae bacterium]|jgi:hypothetical protein|nr:hypothetical protein [Kiritimatiellia bacterium]